MTLSKKKLVLMLLLKWLLETVDLKRQDITDEKTWQTVPWEKTGTTEGETLGLCGKKSKWDFLNVRAMKQAVTFYCEKIIRDQPACWLEWLNLTLSSLCRTYVSITTIYEVQWGILLLSEFKIYYLIWGRNTPVKGNHCLILLLILSWYYLANASDIVLKTVLYIYPGHLK